jgi:hypothetical protein
LRVGERVEVAALLTGAGLLLGLALVVVRARVGTEIVMTHCVKS